MDEEVVIYREEVVGLLFAVHDMVVTLISIESLLKEDDDGEEDQP